MIAGGGGDGAPLFSRPQPQSKGKTPGGRRQLHATHARSTKKHDNADRNPGVRRDTTASSATTPVSEPSRDHKGTGTVSAGTGVGTAASSTGPSTATGSHRKGDGAGLAATGAGADPAGSGSGGTHLTRGAASLATGAAGHEIKGILIGALAKTGTRDTFEPGAPGLHGAGAGGNQTPWLAIGIGVAIALLALAGSQLERRRPEVTL